jgi:hypothetical protein
MKSPISAMIAGGIAAVSALFCWISQLPPASSKQWPEKMWAVHKANHLFDYWAMMAFAFSAAVFFVITFYRWLRICGEHKRMGRS